MAGRAAGVVTANARTSPPALTAVSKRAVRPRRYLDTSTIVPRAARENTPFLKRSELTQSGGLARVVCGVRLTGGRADRVQRRRGKFFATLHFRTRHLKAQV